MQGRSGVASKIETESVIDAYHQGETFYLGKFSIQKHDTSLYSLVPNQAKNRLNVKKGDEYDSFLDEETGAIITIPRSNGNGEQD